MNGNFLSKYDNMCNDYMNCILKRLNARELHKKKD